MPSTPLHDPLAPPAPGATTETRVTTCYICACRCGIRVHLRDDEVRYIDGNPDHPTALLLAALFVQYAGLLAERWFFFAEANHPQNLCYQAVA